MSGGQRWATIFIWIGANAITLYFLNVIFGFVPFASRFVGGDFAGLLDRVVTQGTGGFVMQTLGLVFAVILAGYFPSRLKRSDLPKSTALRGALFRERSNACVSG